MNELAIDVLKLLYDEKEQIIKSRGWSEHKIRKHIENCDKSQLKLALQWLASKKYIDETKINTNMKGYDGKNIKLSDIIFKISSNGIDFYMKGQKNMEQLEGLKKLVDNDLGEIESMESKSYKQLLDLYSVITSRYHYYVPKFSSNLYGYIPDIEMYDIELTENTIKTNLNRIKAKLETFKATGYQIHNENQRVENQPINITNNNNLDNQIMINVSFEQVRKTIEDMSSIGEQEIKEIKEKINIIEDIISANDTKRSKWSKVAPILKWIADKGVDVGISILPLILKIK